MQADALAGVAATFPIKESMLLPIYIQANPSIAKSHVCSVNNENQNWTIDIKAYLRTRALPENPKHAHKIRVQYARFTLMGDDLYKRSFGGLYLRCLTQLEIQYVLSKCGPAFFTCAPTRSARLTFYL